MYGNRRKLQILRKMNFGALLWCQGSQNTFGDTLEHFLQNPIFFLENLLPPWEFSMARFGVWKPPKAQNYEKKQFSSFVMVLGIPKQIWREFITFFAKHDFFKKNLPLLEHFLHDFRKCQAQNQLQGCKIYLPGNCGTSMNFFRTLLKAESRKSAQKSILSC